MKEALSKNFSELRKLYPDHTDFSFQTEFTNHWHIWIAVGMGYVVSVVQEPIFSKTNNLEYALLYMGDLIYLEEHGDNVARFQTLQQVIDFIERVKKEKGEQYE